MFTDVGQNIGNLLFLAHFPHENEILLIPFTKNVAGIKRANTMEVEKALKCFKDPSGSSDSENDTDHRDKLELASKKFV